MSEVEDLITDIGSIVSSVRPCDIVTLRQVEEDYKAIYGKSIPFGKYGFSSLLKLLENFPNLFKIYFANGIPAVRSNTRNNITALISKERKSKKPKHFQNNGNQSKNISTKYLRVERPVQVVPTETLMQIFTSLFEKCDGGIHKGRISTLFKQHFGYELNYRSFGFSNINEVLSSLNGRVLTIQDDLVFPLPIKGPSLFDILQYILSKKTGYTLQSLQHCISQNSSNNILTLIRNTGRFSFDDVVQDAHVRNILCYDQHFVYGATQRHSTRISTYPTGVSHIKIVSAVAPDDFVLEIVANESLCPRHQVHDTMQRLAASEPLLTMFYHNHYCSLEYNGEWYRAIIDSVRCDLSGQSVTVYFIDFPYELERGFQVSLPTNRLRFVPVECESMFAYVHRGSLAYVGALDGRQWTMAARDTFRSMATDDKCSYESYIVETGPRTVVVDVVARTRDGDKWALFQRLVSLGLARSTL